MTEAVCIARWLCAFSIGRSASRGWVQLTSSPKTVEDDRYKRAPAPAMLPHIVQCQALSPPRLALADQLHRLAFEVKQLGLRRVEHVPAPLVRPQAKVRILEIADHVIL